MNEANPYLRDIVVLSTQQIYDENKVDFKILIILLMSNCNYKRHRMN